jgi:beta-galactosidase
MDRIFLLSGKTKSSVLSCVSTGILLLSFIIMTGCGPRNSFESISPIQYMYQQNQWRNRPFDFNWKFFLGDIAGAELPDFDDYNWRNLDIPHDWSIEDLPASADTFADLEPPRTGPFTPASEGGLSTGFALGGTGWYRKTFTQDTNDLGKIVYIRFDGVYMNADFWINGHHLGNHPYGYTSFYYDLTPYLNLPGDLNTLAVQVKNLGENSRWYSGSGIYRHVWLDVVDRVHISPWGVYVKTRQVQSQRADLMLRVSIRSTINQETPVTIRTRLISPEGQSEKTIESEASLAAENISNFEQSITVDNPRLWSTHNPYLYLAEVSILKEDMPLDQYVTSFGIRTLEFDADSGFKLNGKKVLLRGGNMHHDNGPLGAAAIDRAEYRRVELMKSFGYNAIRTSHNPPSPQFLDACDEVGMLVMDEAFDMWREPKNPQDYHLYFDEWWRRDLESMILRDRHHPSVILWSIGNEIRERADTSGLILARKMTTLIKNLDDTRPVTEAICRFWDHPGRPWEDTYPAFEQLDVAGYNYQWQKYEPDHELHPDWIMAGTESIALEAYDYWNQVRNHGYVIGDFLWTGMDYLGEASIGHSVLSHANVDFLLEWPWFNAYCGDIDLCGFKKPQSYYRDVVWGLSQIEMNVHRPIPEGLEEKVSFWGWPDEWPNWNWAGQEGKPIRISIYSSCDSVQLVLNNNDFGFKTLSKYLARYRIPYEPGELKAFGWIHGKIADSTTLITTGVPASIQLIPDRPAIKANLNDLSYVKVEILDQNGNFVPDANLPIQFDIQGNGKLAGVGNGNPTDMKSFQTPRVSTFRGRCLVIIQPSDQPGTIRLIASSEGLQPGTVEIQTR